MEWVTKQGVELAKVGTWNTLTGKWTCTPGQIRDAVRAQEHPSFSNRKPKIRLGHTDPRFVQAGKEGKDGGPAFGSVSNLRASEDGNTLVGDITYPSTLDGHIEHMYPSRSIESALGVTTADGQHFEMVMTGLALLGETPPAIGSLADLEAFVSAAEGEPDWTAATTISASMGAVVQAGAWTEGLHPRQGGKFVAKGSGETTTSKSGKTVDKTDQAATVAKLQKELIRLGLMPKGGTVTGKFGPKTQAAVMRWQKRAGHAATGKVTPALLGALTAAPKGADPKKFTEHRMALRKAGKLPGQKPVKPTAKKATPKKAPVKPVVRKKAPARPKAAA